MKTKMTKKEIRDGALLIFSIFTVIAIIWTGGYVAGKHVTQGWMTNLPSGPVFVQAIRGPAIPVLDRPLPATFPSNFIGLPPITKSPEKALEIPEIKGEYVEFPKHAFKVRIPEEWLSVDPSTFNTKPYLFNNIEQVFVHKKNACAILLAGDPSVEHGQSRMTYPVAFGNDTEKPWLRSIVANRDLIASYAPPNSATNTRMTFLGGGRNEPYRPYEYLSLYLQFSEPDRFAFRVISTTDDPLSETCELESRGIVKTLESTIVSEALPNMRNGNILVAEDRFEKTSGRGLFFVDTNTHMVRKIFTLPLDAYEYSFLPSTQDFYFSTTEKQPTIVRLHFSGDGITKRIFTPADGLVVPQNSIISDFLPSDHLIYYLTGPTSCHDYRGQCPSTFHAYDTASQKTKTIATGLTRNRIIGISKSLESALLVTPFGDAGCWNRTFDRVHLLTGKVVSAGSFGGCEDYENPPKVRMETPEERGEAEVTRPYRTLDNETYILSLNDGHVRAIIEPKTTVWGDRAHFKFDRQYHMQSFPIRILEETETRIQ